MEQGNLAAGTPFDAKGEPGSVGESPPQSAGVGVQVSVAVGIPLARVKKGVSVSVGPGLAVRIGGVCRRLERRVKPVQGDRAIGVGEPASIVPVVGAVVPVVAAVFQEAFPDGVRPVRVTGREEGFPGNRSVVSNNLAAA